MLTIHINHKPVTALDITPETSEKRSGGTMYEQENVHSVPMVNVVDSFSDRPIKKMKNIHRPPPLDLAQMYAVQNPYDSYNWAPNGNTPLNGPNSGHAWRDSMNLSVPPPHLSPYPHGEWNSAPPTEYARSPQLDFDVHAPHATQAKFGSHLAPMAAHQVPSPVESSFGQPQVGYFPRSHSAAGFLPNQQNDYMQQHQLQQQQLHHHHQQQYQHQLQQQQMAQVQLAPPQASFDYGSPFVNDWPEQDFTTSS